MSCSFICWSYTRKTHRSPCIIFITLNAIFYTECCLTSTKLIMAISFLVFRHTRYVNCASLVAQLVKNLPAMQEMWVQSLGQEDPLEKEMEIHSSILAWEIPWTEKPCGLWSMWSQESYTT